MKRKLDYHNMKNSMLVEPKLSDKQIKKVKDIVKRKEIIKCPDCGGKMTMFGINEKGQYKYSCEKCCNIEIVNHTV